MVEVAAGECAHGLMRVAAAVVPGMKFVRRVGFAEDDGKSSRSMAGVESLLDTLGSVVFEYFGLDRQT